MTPRRAASDFSLTRRCDAVTVQRALGHGTATITLDIYAHLWPTAKDKTRAAAASMLAETQDTVDSVRTTW